jgi:hypothetical protein
MTDPDDRSLEDIIAELSKNSEAGVALVTVAVIDEWLLNLLLAAMRPLSNKVLERIFGAGRALYDVAPKADMAYAFSLIDEETLKKLRALKEVRDLFAHTRDSIHFRSPDVVQACQALPGFKKDADALTLFGAVAVEVVKAIDAKTQQLIFDYATRDDASPETP